MARLLTEDGFLGLCEQYRRSQRRLFCLDYDGTLRPFAPTPAQAVPPAGLLRLLGALAADPANTVAVVSGRDQATLDAWFGGLPIGLSAEHGQFMRPAGGVWRDMSPGGHSWKQPVQSLLQDAVRGLPGAFIEPKQTALCLHYRLAQAQAVPAVLTRLAGQLQPLGLVLVHGDKVLEVRKSLSTKAAALEYWHAAKAGFVLAAGDDTTDETMFAAAPPGAVTIKVRPGATGARYRLPTPGALKKLLTQLLEHRLP